MPPLIGLNMALDEKLMSNPLKARAMCHLKYIDAIAGAGGIPVLLPPYTDRTMLAPAVAKLDGFCLIGGRDYLPEHYGGHAQPPDDLMHPRRHQFDLWLAEALMARSRLPILGICGGHQLLNISLGGALIQDLRSEWKSPERRACTLKHASCERENTPEAENVYRHEVKLEPSSRLAQIVGSKKVLTNSFHHQAAAPDRLGRGLKATGWTSDGVIEVLESESPERFLIGVQWHPERQTEEPAHQAIFAALVNAAAEAH